MNMMKEEAAHRFSKRTLAVFDLPSGKQDVWYEYLPVNASKQVQKDIWLEAMESYLTDCRRDEKFRALSLNMIMGLLAINAPKLTIESSKEEWFDVYWQLYLHGFIAIGYNKDVAMEYRVFSSYKGKLAEMAKLSTMVH